MEAAEQEHHSLEDNNSLDQRMELILPDNETGLFLPVTYLL